MADKKNIEPLPPQKDKFWLDAENTLHEPKLKSCGGKHIYKQLSTREAECVECRIGFVLTPGMVVRDGHIYMLDELVL